MMFEKAEILSALAQKKLSMGNCPSLQCWNHQPQYTAAQTSFKYQFDIYNLCALEQAISSL